MSSGRKKRSASKRKYMDLHGLTGQFKTESSDYSIRYFSTFANNRGDNERALLDQLKPMRERVASGSISNMEVLLQRDLDDLRVSKSLIPYLQNQIPNQFGNPQHIAFFPAILAVLIPKDFIQSKDCVYPTLEKEIVTKETQNNDISEGDELFNYVDSDSSEKSWILEQWSDDEGGMLPLGKLKIHEDSTHVVVLDGQHRANAFRVLSGNFLNNQKSNIYEAFYENIETVKSYEADLPVTLIWFESNGAIINPNMISRELFIAVNNNARTISRSRSILLNEKEPTHFLTRCFYNQIAEDYSYDTSNNTISLLHLGFDVNTDLKDHSSHAFTITKPEIMESIFNWCYFGSRIDVTTMDRYAVIRQAGVFDQSHVFEKYFKNCARTISKVSEDEDSDSGKIINSKEGVEKIEKDFNDLNYTIFKRILSEWSFLKPHYEATSWIEEQRNKTWTTDVPKVAWDKIFKGGEGLYYSFKNLTGSVKGKDYRDACTQIETDFKKRRSQIYGINESAVNEAYRSLSTKAFQTGLFMTFFDFVRLNRLSISNIDKPVEEYIKRLNLISNEVWINVLSDVRSEFVGAMDPKKWPYYHKIILRLFQAAKAPKKGAKKISKKVTKKTSKK